MKTADRLMREVREAHTALIWHLPRTDAQGKRLATIHARRLMERTRELWMRVKGR